MDVPIVSCFGIVNVLHGCPLGVTLKPLFKAINATPDQALCLANHV